MTASQIIAFPATGKSPPLAHGLHGAGAPHGREAPPRRLPNSELRPREHLVPSEVERLIKTARGRGRGRCAQRDAAAILVCYTHGLRVCELVALKWSQFDLDSGVVHINRRKGGKPSTQPLRGVELRALRQLRRLWPEGQHLFQTESNVPWAEAGFRTMLARCGEAAGFEWRVHPHQLRHATGYRMANQGTDTRTIQAYLGHASISNTVRYTELAAGRFGGLWQD